MPFITGLEIHQRNRERVRLYLDDEFAADLPLLEAGRLRTGQCLTESEVEALVGAEAVQSGFDHAVRYLSYRPRSIEEVRRHLVKKNVPDSCITVVVERLQQQGYADDVEFARYWISNRERFKPMGPRALRYELRQKGVDDEIVESLLADLDVSESAYRAAKARLSRYRGWTRQAFRQKLSGMLRRRGFSGDTINDVVLRLQAKLDESEPVYFHQDDMD